MTNKIVDLGLISVLPVTSEGFKMVYACRTANHEIITTKIGKSRFDFVCKKCKIKWSYTK